MKTNLYLDANAGLPVRPEVLETFQRVERDCPANPSSLHGPGRKARAALEEARETVAELLGARRGEIIFTSGATEANNLAILGGARALAEGGGGPTPLFGSRAEHPSVLGPLRILQQEGFPLTLLPLKEGALVDLEGLDGADPESFVSLQWANNETGCVQDLKQAKRRARDSILHCDAVQGWGKLDPSAALEVADLFTLSGHKVGAPKGIGVLRVRETVPVSPILSGGGHQGGLRPGTESPALAAALAEALGLAEKERSLWEESGKEALNHLFRALLEGFPEAVIHRPGPEGASLPNTASVGFPGVDGRALLPACEKVGLALSAGSACSTGAPTPSTVLLAAGVGENLARASLRISFPPGSGRAEGEDAGKRLAEVVNRAYEVAKR
jgi:cysteine desulfurase